MNTAVTPLPADHPLVLAWSRYRTTHQYDQALRWLEHPEHREGQMWAAFMAGWEAHKASQPIVLDGSELPRRQLARLQEQARMSNMMRVVPARLPPSRLQVFAVVLLLVAVTVLVTLWCDRG
jgi:hypothetical protein